jgi:ribosomal 30S subunit maturation factor RimM
MKKEAEDAENYMIRDVIICTLCGISSQMIKCLGYIKHMVEIRNTHILVIKPHRKSQVQLEFIQKECEGLRMIPLFQNRVQ